MRFITCARESGCSTRGVSRRARRVRARLALGRARRGFLQRPDPGLHRAAPLQERQPRRRGAALRRTPALPRGLRAPSSRNRRRRILGDHAARAASGRAAPSARDPDVRCEHATAARARRPLIRARRRVRACMIERGWSRMRVRACVLEHAWSSAVVERCGRLASCCSTATARPATALARAGGLRERLLELALPGCDDRRAQSRQAWLTTSFLNCTKVAVSVSVVLSPLNTKRKEPLLLFFCL